MMRLKGRLVQYIFQHLIINLQYLQASACANRFDKHMIPQLGKMTENLKY